jgi:hypothetical protein
MMRDINGKEVVVSDYLVKDEGDFAWFFKNVEGKWKYFASWTCASLGLVDWNWEEKKKKHEEFNVPQVVRDHDEKTNEWLNNLKVNELEIVGDKLRGYLEQIQNNEEGHMYLTGTLEDPTEDDDEEDFERYYEEA